ncbi:hypothetical protein F5Y15DRAFT_425908 [Xylariaceae sp. FL0016]|nr:hypothetical protein F5Y15DRAFT_425908 [Xylariaceae sp. FL0016]
MTDTIEPLTPPATTTPAATTSSSTTGVAVSSTSSASKSGLSSSTLVSLTGWGGCVYGLDADWTFSTVYMVDGESTKAQKAVVAGLDQTIQAQSTQVRAQASDSMEVPPADPPNTSSTPMKPSSSITVFSTISLTDSPTDSVIASGTPEGFHTDVLAGIIVGAVVGAMLILTIAVLIFRKKRRLRRRLAPPPKPPVELPHQTAAARMAELPSYLVPWELPGNPAGASWDPADLERVRNLLAQYFDRDENRRFEFEGRLGSGANGLAWKVKYTTPVTASPPPTPAPAPPALGREGLPTPPSSSAPPHFATRRIVLKTDRFYLNVDEDFDPAVGVGTSPMQEEKKWLKVLGWALHVVKIIEPPSDPLAQTFPGVRPHCMDVNHWLHMEWLENGVLKTFVQRAFEEGLQPPLPNRLLWRLLMCLIRMCIAMAWPPERPDEEDPAQIFERAETTKPRRRLIHGDMHNENIMIGTLLPHAGSEHDLTPVLKLIDLGSMTEEDEHPSNEESAIAQNLFEVGALILSLATLEDVDMGDLFMSNYPTFTTRRGGPPIRTAARQLLPDVSGRVPVPGLDGDLRNIICRCLTPDEDQRPKVRPLANLVLGAIDQRDEKWYEDRGYSGDESDEHIRGIVDQLIFNTSDRDSAPEMMDVS